jgi:hypothetical protein
MNWPTALLVLAVLSPFWAPWIIAIILAIRAPVRDAKDDER